MIDKLTKHRKEHKLYQLYLNAQLITAVAEQDIFLYYLNILPKVAKAITLRIQKYDSNQQ